MGARTGYPEGTFSWVDLATTDPVCDALGWTPDERMADGRAYTVLRRE
ncbi:hypothetical protein MB901379_00575 [Mycobacterium basiliense]|uniref:Uncharacterized protein n=1 Tax=Mycobacterium basiliense TaxID=2094119 RepID=A0A447G9F4_9MYCO|nr:hypothetical protein [Mycobacterium basiliense]VDM87041.1 hypothetical protein MB901379_00575 [Mycobacterium basiliense]